MVLNSKLFILILFILLSATLAQETMTIDEAIHTALQNNREIQVATLEIERARAAVSEAFGYALPSLDLSANFSHFLQKPKMPFPDFAAMLNNSTYGVLFDENIIPYDPDKFLPMDTKLQTFAQANNYQTKAELTQILFNSAVFTGIGASHIYLDLSKENLKRTISKTVLNVKKAFYGVLLTKDLLLIANSRFDNANDHLENVKSMRAHGLIAEFDEMRAEVQVENIRPIILQLENAHKEATNGLKILLKMDQDKPLLVTGSMDYKEESLPGEKKLIDEAVNSNLDIKTLTIKKQVDEEFVNISRSDYWPTIAAFANYSYSGSAERLDFQNYNSSMVGISISINIFKGFRTSNKVQQEKIGVNKTVTQISSLTDLVISKVKAKLNELKRVQELIKSMEKNIKLAERAYEIAENRYKEGEGIQLEVKNADIELSQAKINYTNAIHDYSIAKAELYDLVGRVDNKYYEFVDEYLEN